MVLIQTSVVLLPPAEIASGRIIRTSNTRYLRAGTRHKRAFAHRRDCVAAGEITNHPVAKRGAARPHKAVMSFHSPLPLPPSGPSSSDASGRRVSCDLPARLDVLPGEVDLLEMWLGGLIADLVGGSGMADSTNEEKEDK